MKVQRPVQRYIHHIFEAKRSKGELDGSWRHNRSSNSVIPSKRGKRERGLQRSIISKIECCQKVLVSLPESPFNGREKARSFDDFSDLLVPTILSFICRGSIPRCSLIEPR